MERLTRAQETEITHFHNLLKKVVGLDDMFPPEAGVRELHPTPEPTLPPVVSALAEEAILASAEDKVLVAA